MSHGVVIFVKEVERVARFYRELTSMTVLHEEPGLCVLGSGGFELTLHAIPPQYADGIDIATPPQPREDSYLKVVLPCERLAEARLAAQRLGGWLHGPEREWSGRGFTACDGVDPEGNILQLRQPG